MRDAVPERTRRVLSRRAKVLSQHALQRESQILFGGCDVVVVVVVVVVVGGGDVGLRTPDEGDDLVPAVQVGDDVRCWRTNDRCDDDRNGGNERGEHRRGGRGVVLRDIYIMPDLW